MVAFRRNRQQRVEKLRLLRQTNKQKEAETASLQSAAAVMANAAMVMAASSGQKAAASMAAGAGMAVGGIPQGGMPVEQLTVDSSDQDVASAVHALNGTKRPAHGKKRSRTDERERKEREKARCVGQSTCSTARACALESVLARSALTVVFWLCVQPAAEPDLGGALPAATEVEDGRTAGAGRQVAGRKRGFAHCAIRSGLGHGNSPAAVHRCGRRWRVSACALSAPSTRS